VTATTGERPARRPPGWLLEVPLAHRGLHGAGRIENALPAFAAAAEAGYGAELDVRLSADRVPVVVHDRDLVRVAGVERRVDALTAAELRRVRLHDGTVGVPTLAEALAVLAAVPVMVEVKQGRVRPGTLEAEVARVLDRHPGPVCVAGFHPGTIAWFRRHRPDVVRVQTAMATATVGRPTGATRPLVLRRVDPHAVSHDLAGLSGPGAQAWRRRGGALVAWTVRDAEALERARRLADNLIFEGVRP